MTRSKGMAATIKKARAAIKEIYEAKPSQLPPVRGKRDSSGTKRLSGNRRKK